MRYLRQVHAKVYIIDAQEAIVSSANLTDPGLKSNLEIGVKPGDTKAVSQLIEILKPFWDAAKPINPESLPSLEEITKFMDKYETGRAEHELDLVCEMDPSNGFKQLLEGADTAGRIIWRTKKTTYVKNTRALVEENMPDRATIRYRDRLLKELRPLMTQGKIARLTKDDVEFILSELQGGFGAIGLPNIDLILGNGIGRIRSNLFYLFWGDGDDQTRLANMLLPGIHHLDGAGIGVLSTLLMVSNPDRYPIYNESIRRGLESLLPNVALRSDASDYLHFAEVAADLKEIYSIPNSALDFVLWSIGKSETET